MKTKGSILDPFPLNQRPAYPHQHGAAAVGADARRRPPGRQQKISGVDLYRDGMKPVRTNIDNVRI